MWDVESLACLATLQGHSGAVRALAASPDRVFSGSDDTTIKARSHQVKLCCGVRSEVVSESNLLDVDLGYLVCERVQHSGGGMRGEVLKGCLCLGLLLFCVLLRLGFFERLAGRAGVGQPHATVPAYAGGA